MCSKIFYFLLFRGVGTWSIKPQKCPYVINEQPHKTKFKIYNFGRILNFLLGVQVQIPEIQLSAGEEYRPSKYLSKYNTNVCDTYQNCHSNHPMYIDRNFHFHPP